VKTQKIYPVLTLFAAVALFVLVSPLTPPAQAQPFELDGNAVSEGGTAGVDWDVVNNGGGGAIAKTGLVIDRPEPSMAQFHGGGSKDEQNIPKWGWRGGTPPAKDDLTNAYAAAFEDDSNHFILVFGMDRYDTSGDAQLGFWFLQDEVQPVAGGDFSGFHIDGDLLVLVNFSGGGDVPTINVYEWIGGGVVSLGVGGDVLCTGGYLPGGADFCGITNAGNVTAPWNYENKDVGVTNMFPPAAFFEGAIDLTALNLTSCFTNFLAESRSSTSITATLKDFATPESGFDVCSIDVTKNCTDPRLNSTEDMIIYDIKGKVTNDGFGTLYNIGLSDSPAADGAFQVVDCTTGDPIDSQTFPLTSLAGGGTEACYLNTITVPLAQNGLTDTVTVTSNTESDNSGSTISDSDDAICPNLQISPALSISKDCEDTQIVVESGLVAVKVNISGTVCNVGDSMIDNVTVTDDHVSGNLLSGETLIAPDDINDPGATEGACANFTGSYLPSTATDADDEPTTDPSAVRFKDTATATATDILGNAVTPQSDMADCPLCP
jgi:hypothetical protein